MGDTRLHRVKHLVLGFECHILLHRSDVVQRDGDTLLALKKQLLEMNLHDEVDIFAVFLLSPDHKMFFTWAKSRAQIT